MPPVLLAGLALLAAVISYPVFPAAVPANGLPGYDTLVHGLGLLPDWCTLAASSMLLLVQAIHLNLILNKHGVLFKISWLPALLYLLLASMLLPVFGFNPAMVVNSLLIFVLDKLFGLYKNPSSWGMIFDAGLLLSLAALIYLPTLLLSFYFFIALALIRPWSWREWMIGLLGLAAPLFFAAVYLFMVDGLQSYLQEVFLPGIRIELSSGQQFQRVQLVSVVLIGLIFLMAVINAQSNYYRNVAKTRVSQQLLLILVPFSLCTLLVAPDAAVYRVGLASIPLAVYLAYFFLAGRNMWIMEACMLLLLAAWTANRLMPF